MSDMENVSYNKKRYTAEGTKKQQLSWEQETWREEVGVNVEG